MFTPDPIINKFSKIVLYSFFFFATNLFSICHAFQSNITKQDSYFDTTVNFFNKEGNKVFLDQFENTTILLVFWATWCGSCVGEMASLDNLQKDFRKLPFKVVAVSQDYHGVKTIDEFYKINQIRHLDIFYDYHNKLFKDMSIPAIPTAILINSQGKIKKTFKGIIKWHDDDIRAMILEELDGNYEMPKNTYRSSLLNKSVW